MALLTGTFAATVHRALRYNLVRLYPVTIVTVAFQAFFLYVFHYNKVIKIHLDAGGILLLVLSFVPMVAGLQLGNLLLHGRRVPLVVFNLAGLFLYTLLIMYHLDTRSSLDYQLVHDNFREIFFVASVKLIFTGLGKWLFMGLWVFVGIMVILEWWIRIFSRWSRPPNWRLRAWLSAVAIAGVLAAPVFLYDDVVYLAQTAFRYYVPIEAPIDLAALKERGIDPAAPYPYHKPAAPGVEPPLEGLPHVFIIEVESFNANYAEARTPEGKEYTPYFNSLVKKGVYFEQFYGNSVQTVRGQVALMCGILPSMKGKIFTNYRRLNLHCLPEILREKGYHAIFLEGQEDLEFDNTDRGMKRLGFEEAHAMDKAFAKGIDRKFFWGWGFQDNMLFRRVFEHLDAREAQYLSADPSAPRRYFTLIATISNHMPFAEIPKGQEYVYPDAHGYVKNYANSIFLSDHYMKEFFFKLQKRPYLKNSIVIVVGDHSFPIDEHEKNHHNEVYAYEENFRTPMLLIWDGHLKPRCVGGRAFSQIDVAPTLMELLGIRAENHFLGRSMLADDPPGGRVAHVIQPYDGRYLGAVRWPMKYLKHLRTNREFLYDLAADPHEDHNVAGDPVHRDEMDALRKEISVILHNQRLIVENRIWPPPPTDADAGTPLDAH